MSEKTIVAQNKRDEIQKRFTEQIEYMFYCQTSQHFIPYFRCFCYSSQEMQKLS